MGENRQGMETAPQYGVVQQMFQWYHLRFQMYGTSYAPISFVCARRFGGRRGLFSEI